MKQVKQIGIICGKFKPPHAGHFNAIRDIADLNYETHIFVSPKETDGVTGQMAVDILDEYFKTEPNERQEIFIHLAKASPVKEAYEFIYELGQREDAADFAVNLYSLEDDMDRFSTIEKFIGNLSGIKRFTTKRTSDLSGTKMRKAIHQGDKETFKRGLPTGSDYEKIWAVVKEEAGGSYAIPADSFDTKKEYDFNVSSTDISYRMGAIPNFWTNSAPYSRWDLNPSNNITTFRRNPIGPTTGKHVKTFAEYLETEGK